MIKPTENELVIIHKLRCLKPYEKIEVLADKEGVPNKFIVVRSRTEKILFNTDGDPKYLM